ncbi:MAG TPA: hypothetical protein VFC98_00465 [Clostridia bacterium]|nr:hypothetical protein [Clostridia bacterium]
MRGAAESQDELKKKYIKKIKRMCGKEGNWLREKMFHKFTADELRDLIRHIEDAQLEAVDEYKRISKGI